MNHVKALLFDVGGTVFDWKNTTRANIQKLAATHNQPMTPEVIDAFAVDWRVEMFNVMTEVRTGVLPWMNADEINLRALEKMSGDYPLLSLLAETDTGTGSGTLTSLVKDTWHHLQVFDGAAEAIDRLRSKYTVVVLTVLSWESIVSSSKAAGVQWDGILSCEFLGYYKPSPQAYLKGISLLGLTPAESMMVAAHEADLAAAQSVGLHTALVKVPEEDTVFGGVAQPETENFDINATDFDDLCQKLGI